MLLVISNKTIAKIFFILLLIATFYFWRNHIAQAQAEVVYFVEGQEQEISLTFNVFYGEEHVQALLNVLEENEVKATFFLTGEWIEKYPTLAREIQHQGHEVGSYTYCYSRFNELKREQIVKDFELFQTVAQKTLYNKPKLFRPPYGEYNSLILKEAQRRGYRTVIWTINSQNWFTKDRELIINNVKQRIRGGEIILFHSSDPGLPETLSKLIIELKKLNFELVTVSTLLG